MSDSIIDNTTIDHRSRATVRQYIMFQLDCLAWEFIKYFPNWGGVQFYFPIYRYRIRCVFDISSLSTSADLWERRTASLSIFVQHEGSKPNAALKKDKENGNDTTEGYYTHLNERIHHRLFPTNINEFWLIKIWDGRGRNCIWFVSITAHSFC